MTTKSEFANNVATRLRATELSLDNAIADLALLTHDLTRHRASAGFGAEAGHPALLAVHASASAMVEARSQIVTAHHQLGREAKARRIVVNLGGPLEDKGTERPTGVRPAVRETI